MKQKPAYSLMKGDSFIGDDGRTWIVDEAIQPSDWTSLREVNTPPKNWEIRAHAGQMNRRFYFSGAKLLQMKD